MAIGVADCTGIRQVAVVHQQRISRRVTRSRVIYNRKLLRAR
jgi:hypothetical protein